MGAAGGNRPAGRGVAHRTSVAETFHAPWLPRYSARARELRPARVVFAAPARREQARLTRPYPYAAAVAARGPAVPERRVPGVPLSAARLTTESVNQPHCSAAPD